VVRGPSKTTRGGKRERTIFSFAATRQKKIGFAASAEKKRIFLLGCVFLEKGGESPGGGREDLGEGEGEEFPLFKTWERNASNARGHALLTVEKKRPGEKKKGFETKRT